MLDKSEKKDRLEIISGRLTVLEQNQVRQERLLQGVILPSSPEILAGFCYPERTNDLVVK